MAERTRAALRQKQMTGELLEIVTGAAAVS
jgi:F0F1-type ATP synthase gamma subunit